MRTAGHSLIYSAVTAAMLTASLSAAAYTVNIQTGTIPKDVVVKNETGLEPYAKGYNRGFTKDGWTTDRYSNRGYVALCPTFTGKAEASRNSLTLPELEIKEGDYLQWEALSMHPDRPEHYLVEATGVNGKTTLLEVKEESPEWANHMIDLSAYAGQKLTISFICVSENRYMLVLDKIKVGAPEGLSLSTRDLTETYCGAEAAEAGHTDVKVEITNIGSTLTAGAISLEADYEPAGSIKIDTPWKPGETRSFTLRAPVSKNHRTVCELYYANGEEKTLLTEKIIYCSNFKRRLMADKGTGMWCNNCPRGILDMEKLSRQFGKSLSVLDTHISDVLQNQQYFDNLGYLSVPWMMLNRTKTSAAGNTELFFNFYYRPVKFDICFTKAGTTGNEKATVAVSVRCAEETDNTSGRYRVGYVMTGDFHMEENDAKWYQENSSKQPTDDRFYYLPAHIPSPLAYFHHVTLTSDHAFDGFEGSLPATMSPGTGYSFSWDIERPELLEQIKEGRVVAFVLDTESGEVMNCAEVELMNPDLSGVEEISAPSDTNGASIAVGSDGKVTVTLSDASDFTLEAWTVDGRRAASVTGRADNRAEVTLPVANGVYVLRLKSACGNATCKTIM